ncbi:outer membrane beta-barrel protein [Geminicoccus roseus]|uniref:outer membrane beta-barrel protein n=1 Tax=Geminicoccus roseus TaxID=404900 RepID=UPI00041C34F8|nr:outer membrane beta-barrel protein [Geminicoccus roseus]
MRWTLLTTTALGALVVLSGMASAQDTGAIGEAQQALDNRAYQIGGQEVDPNVAVQDRPRPDYDPLGIRRGSFYFFPSIDASVSYDSNVNATQNNEKDDIIFGLTPRINMVTDWSRHRLEASAYLNAAKYLEQDENDFTDYGLDLGGRYDVSSAGAFRGEISYDHLHEGKDDNDRITVGEGDVVEYDLYSATGGYQHRFNRIALSGNLVYRLYDWDSFNIGGVTIDQDYRNRQEYGGNLRLTYALSPRLGLFTQADYLFYNYDNPSPGGNEQDSEKYGLRVGTSVDFTSILFGEASIGYVKQAYKNDAFDDEDGVSADIGLTWNVTTLSTLQLVGSRDFLPSSTGGSSRLSTDIALIAHHELLRNLILNGTIAYENEDYKQSPLEKDIYQIGFGADYLITRNFAAGAEYLYKDQDSTAQGGDYDKHVVMLRLRAQM